MEDVREELEPVDQARTGPREVRGGVDRDDAARAQGGELVGVLAGLVERALGVDSRTASRSRPPARRRRPSPSRAPSRARRVRRGGRGRRRTRSAGASSGRRRTPGRATRAPRRCAAARRGRRAGRGRSARRARATQRDALVAPSGRLRDRADVGQRLADRVRVERDHARPGRQLGGERGDLVVGDGADRAQRLGHDQVRARASAAGPRRARRSTRRPRCARARRRRSAPAPSPAGSVSRVAWGSPAPRVDSRIRGSPR